MAIPEDVRLSCQSLTPDKHERLMKVVRPLVEYLSRNVPAAEPVRQEKKLRLVVSRSTKKCRACGGEMSAIEHPGGMFELCKKGCNEHDLTQLIRLQQYMAELGRK